MCKFKYTYTKAYTSYILLLVLLTILNFGNYFSTIY